METVILVNKADEPVGRMEKLEAHRLGLLHRAFSVFLINSEGQTLLQQRAAGKYHSPLLWTNSCCSHQREGESNLEAATRRLSEELGINSQELHDAGYLWMGSLKRWPRTPRSSRPGFKSYSANTKANLSYEF